MERRQFLESLGIGAAFVLTASCLQSCSKTSGGGAVDFTLDLSATENKALLTNGGFVKVNGVVVAKDTSGNLVAATQTCSHEGNVAVSYNSGANEFQCSVHGARFSLTGAGLNANGSGGLTIYKTTLTGTSLRVFS